MDKSTDVICLSYSIDYNEPKIWYPGLEIPQDLHQAMCVDKALIYGWNSTFEWCIWDYVLIPKYDFFPLNFTQLRDTQAIAMYYALPAALENCGLVLGIENQKDKRGDFLISKLSVPQKITGKNKQKRWTKDFKPQLHEEMYEYCKQDVRAEQEILLRLPSELPENELNLWRQTLVKNRRGLPIDIELVDSVIDVTEEYLEDIAGIVPILTDGIINTVNQTKKIVEWCELQGYEIPNLTAETVETSLNDPDISNYPKVKQLFEIRQMVGKSSVKKFQKMSEAVCNDNRIRDCLKYHGATTGREGGRLLQPQNLPRATVKNVEETVEAFKSQDIGNVVDLHENVMFAASAMIRPSICAPPKKRFVVLDYSSIENYKLCWLAGQEDALDLIRSGQDPYCDMASSLYDFSYDEIYNGYKADDSKFESIRRHGKLTILGAGYGMGHKKFHADCQSKQFFISLEESKRTIDIFRDKYNMVVAFWYGLEDAAKLAVNNEGKLTVYGMIGFIYENNFLAMILPNGKQIHYYNPKIKEVKAPWGAYKESITYEGTVSGNKNTGILHMIRKGWGRLILTPGQLAENASQGSSREVLMSAQLDVEREGFPTILTVHDELVLEVDDDLDCIETIRNIMVNRGDEYSGLPLKAEGFYCTRYRK